MTEQPKSHEAKKRQTVETYDKSAEALAAKFDRLGARVPDIETAFALVAKTNPKVLEIGCGNGRDAQAILERTDNYLGVDISSELIKLARQKNPTGTFEVADITSFNFPSNTDIVFAFASLIHLDRDELRAVLEKIFVSLNASGIAHISMKQSDAYAEVTKIDEFGTRTYYHYSAQELATLAEGFLVLENTIVDRNGQQWVELTLQKP